MRMISERKVICIRKIFSLKTVCLFYKAVALTFVCFVSFTSTKIVKNMKSFLAKRMQHRNPECRKKISKLKMGKI